MWAQIINMLIGIWLIASPGIVDYNAAGADSNHIVGPVIATFAMVACWEATRGARKFNIPLGLWLIAAPWVLGYETLSSISNDTLCGLGVTVLALIRGRIHGRYGGGWEMLWKAPDRRELN